MFYCFFIDLTHDLLAPWAGFVAGWIYWLFWMIAGVAEMIVVAGYAPQDFLFTTGC